MLSKKAIKYFKEKGYSFEEIEGIKQGLMDVENGKVISEQEMDDFIKKELFSKYRLRNA